MSKERLEEIEKRVFSRTFHTGLEVDMITIPERDYIYLKEQAERVQELEDKLVSFEVWYMLLEQENETLRSANEDLLKENHTLKNFKKVNIDHPSNKFF